MAAMTNRRLRKRPPPRKKWAIRSPPGPIHPKNISRLPPSHTRISKKKDDCTAGRWSTGCGRNESCPKMKRSVMREYDIYLPTARNDGAPIDEAALEQIKQSLTDAFGGYTHLTHHNEGAWRMGGVT